MNQRREAVTRGGETAVPAVSRGNGFRFFCVCLALLALVGCKTVREELQPVRETTLTVARSGGDVTLSWIGVRGTYYTVMYTDARGGRAQWIPLPDAVNIRALASGEAIVVKDRVHETQPRYYRLVQGPLPMGR